MIDYTASATLHRFDLTTGNELDSFALGIDGLTAGLTYAGLTYANDKLYYYDWVSGSGSTLSVFALSGFTEVPEASALAIFCIGFAGMAYARRKRTA